MKRVLGALKAKRWLVTLSAAVLLSGCVENDYGLLGIETVPPAILHTGFYEWCLMPARGALKCDNDIAYYISEYQYGEFLVQTKKDENTSPTGLKLNRLDSGVFAMQYEISKKDGNKFIYMLAIPKNGGLAIWIPSCRSDSAAVQAWMKKHDIKIKISGGLSPKCELPFMLKPVLFDLLKSLFKEDLEKEGGSTDLLFFKPVSEERGVSIWAAEAKKK